VTSEVNTDIPKLPALYAQKDLSTLIGVVQNALKSGVWDTVSSRPTI